MRRTHPVEVERGGREERGKEKWQKAERDRKRGRKGEK